MFVARPQKCLGKGINLQTYIRQNENSFTTSRTRSQLTK